jgi:hypothetical protein
LLQAHLNEVAAHLELVIDVLLDVAMCEQLQHLLLILLYLVYDWDEEHKTEEDRARGRDQHVQKDRHIRLTVTIRLVENGIS